MEQDDLNPFADSAVVSAMEDDPVPAYNPFADGRGGGNSGGGIGGGSSAPGSYTYTDPFKASSSSSSSTSASSKGGAYGSTKANPFDPSYQQQQQQQQSTQEMGNAAAVSAEKQAVRAHMAPGERVPNWPVCKPFMYHSIRNEIDRESQPLVRQIYYSWFLLCVCVVLNFAGCICLLVAGTEKAGDDFGFSILYLVAIPPCALFLWYRPAYNAFRKDSGFQFFIFFVFFAFNIGFLCFMWLGWEGTGSAGLLNMTKLFSAGEDNKGPYIAEGAVCIIVFLMWTMLLLFSIYLFVRVYRHYKSRGHTFKEARDEGLRNAAQSDTGRAAASAAAGAAVRSYTHQVDEV